jgi:hypothetical protein
MSAPAPTFDRSAIVAALKEMRLQIEAIEFSLGGVQYLPPCEPEVAKAEVAKAEPASASDASSGDAPKKERKKREPMSEEAKAAMKAKRAATIAAKAAAAPAPAAPAAPATPTKAPAPSVAPPAPKKAAPRKKVFTLSELRDFTTIVIDGEDHGVNLRGDTMNKAHEFVGLYNEKTAKMDRTAPKPADWDEIVKDEDEDE